MEATGLKHLSTGDLFRENLQNETPLGRCLRAYVPMCPVPCACAYVRALPCAMRGAFVPLSKPRAWESSRSQHSPLLPDQHCVCVFAVAPTRSCTDQGLEAKKYMDKGQLVPDAVRCRSVLCCAPLVDGAARKILKIKCEKKKRAATHNAPPRRRPVYSSICSRVCVFLSLFLSFSLSHTHILGLARRCG